MTCVFLSGSRRCSRLTVAVRNRLDTICQKKMCVLVGDANGVDKAVQTHFAGHEYRNVIVYCSNGVCRNNVGDWPVHSVATDAKPGTRAFFSAKDKAMASDADYGFVIWDGQSKGTYDNIAELTIRGKTALVYTTKDHEFRTVRNLSDLDSSRSHRDNSGRIRSNGNRDIHATKMRNQPEPEPWLF